MNNDMKELSFNELKRKVTSKGGVTESILNSLEDSLPGLFDKSLMKGLERSAELAK